MSMSQEEIESLMFGLEGPEDEKNETIQKDDVPKESPDEQLEEILPVLSKESPQGETQDLQSLLEQVGDVEDSENQEDATALTEEENLENEGQNLQSLLEEMGEEEDDVTPAAEESSHDVTTDIHEVLNEIDNMDEQIDDVNVEELHEEIHEEMHEEILDKNKNEIEDSELEQMAISWTENKIEKGEFPFPAEADTKVVSQLNEVANDSEEKAGQIFDVLSFVMDSNAIMQKNSKKIAAFADSQIALLENLGNKFPNIQIFQNNLEEAKKIKEDIKDISSRLDEEDMQLLSAMELMQFNDINRQKIERVMSVIRKLATYLNNLFDSDGDYEEVAIAKHIHGDSTADLLEGDDLDALISEFNK